VAKGFQCSEAWNVAMTDVKLNSSGQLNGIQKLSELWEAEIWRERGHFKGF
jgi:hypothetical protein